MMRMFSAVWLSTAISLAVAVPAYSQKANTPASPSQSTAPRPTLQITSRLVTVDVVVKKGQKPITGLTQSDFKIYEDGVQQTIRYFTAHSGSQTNASTPPAQAPALPSGTWTNLPIAATSDSVTVLLLDGLNTEPQKLQSVRNAVIQYLKKQRPGTRMAVFALGGKLRLLQDFTADGSQLLIALKKTNAISPSSLLAPQQQSVSEAQQLQSMSDMGMNPVDGANASNSMAQNDASQTAMRVHLTLRALEQLSRYLAGVSGRKNLIWFSGSFPLNFFAIEKVVERYDAGNVLVRPVVESIRSFDPELRRTADAMAAARVAVYPVDARGVLTQRMFAASATNAATGPGDFTGSRSAMQHAGPQGGTVGSDQELEPVQRMADHSTMDVIAQQTGGEAFYENNDLDKAIADVLSDGEDFYTISYVPTNTNYNGAMRKIVIHLKDEKKEKLLYRENYYADSPTASGKGVSGVFLTSMESGVPSSSQIVFHVRLSDQPPSGPVEGQAAAMKNRAARYSIDYSARLDDIDLHEGAGDVRQGGVIVLAIAYRDGEPLNFVQNAVPIVLEPSAWDLDNRQGLPIHQVIDLPPGDVQLRVGLYDPISGHIGSLEIPLHVIAHQ